MLKFLSNLEMRFKLNFKKIIKMILDSNQPEWIDNSYQINRLLKVFIYFILIFYDKSKVLKKLSIQLKF